jgi:hypothetical protein
MLLSGFFPLLSPMRLNCGCLLAARCFDATRSGAATVLYLAPLTPAVARPFDEAARKATIGDPVSLTTSWLQPTQPYHLLREDSSGNIGLGNDRANGARPRRET